MIRRTRGVALSAVLAFLAPLAPRPADAADAAPPPVANGVRLADAVSLALTRNERARISDLNVAVAEANVERARAGFLPVITATGGAQQHAYAASDRTPNTLENAGIVVNQPILNASTYPLYAQAKNLASAQRAQNIDDKRLLAFSAASAFFAVLDATALLQAAQNQLDTAKANLADAQARADAGLTSSNDVTRARVDMASSSRQVEIGQGNVQTSIIDLELVVNARLAAPFTPPAETLSAAERPTGDVESLVAFAVAHRPDLAASKFDALAAHDFASEPLLRIVPTLSLQGQATANSNAATGRWHDEWLQATLNWTLYDAGVRYADRHARDAQASVADLTLRELLRTVDAQVRTAVAALTASQGAFHVSDEAVQAARQSVDETQALYKQGLAKAIELIDANDSRFAAEVSYASAEYAMAQAYLGLRQALGLDPLGTELR
jgi:outer membrane protein TolC